LPVQRLGMVEDFFRAAANGEKQDCIDPERQHPIVADSVDEIGQHEPSRREGQDSFSHQHGDEAGTVDSLLEYREESSAVDIGVFHCLRLQGQPVSEQGERRQFLDESLPVCPLRRLRRLIEEPRCEPFLPLRRDGGVDEVQERMRAGKVEVGGVPMPFRHRDRAKRNVVPA